MLALQVGLAPVTFTRKSRSSRGGFGVWADGFPPFLPKEVERIKDPFARKLAKRIERLPVQLQVGVSEKCIMSSCVKPLLETEKNPVVLLHGFDSSCLEWRCAYLLLEEAGVETWAVDILGWGFSDLERLPSCDVGQVASKRSHLYQLWRSYIKRPMILVGPSLGAAVAIDFAVNHPEAVKQLVLIDASVYTEGTRDQTKLPMILSYAGVSLLKSIPLRLYATLLCFNNISFSTSLDWTNVGRLHCLLPWWEDATVGFMNTGGYNVSSLIEQVKQQTLIIWGEDDQIISSKLAVRLHCELPNAIVRQIPDCGHIPHVEKPEPVAKLIVDFIRGCLYDGGWRWRNMFDEDYGANGDDADDLLMRMMIKRISYVEDDHEGTSPLEDLNSKSWLQEMTTQLYLERVWNL